MATTYKRSELVAKLNPLCRRALENATVIARQRGNPYVEFTHWVEQLARIDNTDFQRIIDHFNLDAARLSADLTAALDRLPRGASAISDFSDHIFDAIERGWARGAMKFGEDSIRSGYVLLAAMQTPRLENLLIEVSAEFEKVDRDDLAEGFAGIVKGSAETAMPAAGSSAAPSDGGKSVLETYATDLTAKAEAGEIDPVVGREAEIRQIVNILMRRRQNNPILTGEAGVGKTAVVEGFALRIIEGDVPPALKNVGVWMLDVGLLQAGASMKGEFENRLRQVIDAVQKSEKPLILFIDEAHTLIGAGGAAGAGDAANLLKPALARGELRTIAATTWAEYKKHIEKDPALTRRFEVVKVEEPSEEKAVRMLRGVASVLERHHEIQILDEALEAAVRLSARYIPARQLPDKAISLLDTACARAAVSRSAVPAAVEDGRRRIESLETELGILSREAAIGLDVAKRAEAAEADMTAAREALAETEERWRVEREAVDAILDLRAKLRADGGAIEEDAQPSGEEPEEAAPEAQPLDEAARAALLDDLRGKLADLTELQKNRPLILPCVDRSAVAAVVEDWTGVPVGSMIADEINALLDLPAFLGKRVIGQGHAMEMIARRIQTARAGLDAPNKPVGVFLLCGPSGVGKTETALALAEALYGGEQNLISINMSEFQEAHTVSTLKGSPPGYVGYGEGGVLTEAVRRRPYAVVLLDEVEKAHADVHEIFFQVFDKGVMEDAEGRRIDFKNTLILLTSNVGSELVMKLCEDPELAPDPEALAKALRAPLLERFPPALLGRMITIPYYPLSDAMIDAIIALQLSRIQVRVRAAYGAELVCDDAATAFLRERCTELESGGRMIDSILTNTILPEVSRRMLTATAEGEEIARIEISAADGAFSYTIVPA